MVWVSIIRRFGLLSSRDVHSIHGDKKGAMRPFLLQLSQQLLVVDVHGDFEAKTNVTVFWSFPFHVNSPH